jgi:ribosomal subunit interface protein
MQISIRGRHIDLGDAFRQHAEDRLGELISKYFENAIEAAVVVDRDGSDIKADITVHVHKGMVIQGSGENSDVYVAFDQAAERIAKQLRRYKRRLSRHPRSDEPVEAQQYVIQPEADDGAELSAEPTDPVIVAEMATDIVSCTVSDAVMRLDLSNQPALMFRNSAHGGLNMIYRRPDGNIGWVDPRGSRSTK